MKLLAFVLILVCVTTAISIKEGNERKIYKKYQHKARKHRDDVSQQQQENNSQQQEDQQQQQEGDDSEQQQEDNSLISQQQQEDNQQQQQEGNQQQQQQQEGNQQQQQQQEGNQQQQQQQEGNQQQQQQQEDSQQQEGNQQQQEDNQQQQQEDGQQQEDNEAQQQQEDGAQQDQQQQQQEAPDDDSTSQQQEDSDKEDSDKDAFQIHVPDSTYFEVFVNGQLEARNMPTHKHVCPGGKGSKEKCKFEWIEPDEGKKNTVSFDVPADIEPKTIVLHGFAPVTAGTTPSMKFTGHGIVSTADSFKCAKNWASFWKDGMTMAPNYRAAFSAETTEDFKVAVPIWVADEAQHHVTCVWTKQACAITLKNPNEPCHLVEDKSNPIPAGYAVSPKLSEDAGAHPKNTIPAYDKIDLSKTTDLGSKKELMAVDVLITEATTQHEDLAGEVAKDCADPLCKGLYSL